MEWVINMIMIFIMKMVFVFVRYIVVIMEMLKIIRMEKRENMQLIGYGYWSIINGKDDQVKIEN